MGSNKEFLKEEMLRYPRDKYMSAGKSLAWPDCKTNWKFAILRPTRRSLLPRRPGWTDNLLNCFWVACKS